MASVQIDLNPRANQTFDAEVEIPTESGSPLRVPFTFRVRSRRELAAHSDAYMTALRELDEAQSRDKFGFEERESRFVRIDADAIMRAAAGWGVDAPFNVDTVSALLDKYPAAANAINAKYRAGVLEGRVGN